MFMLTHTYFLQKILGSAEIKNVEPDIFVYNIAPDLLAIHPDITSARTHKLRRLQTLPVEYPKAAYVIYHLLIDDLSHYGYICTEDGDAFDIHSRGYSYRKGNPLIRVIQDIHGIAGKEISCRDAVYQSHLIIEMIYDLVIVRHLRTFKTVEVMVDAIKYTVENRMEEFTETLRWLYGLEVNQIREVMRSALLFITQESMEQMMTIQGRMHLYQDKFGLPCNDLLLNNELNRLFEQAIDLIDDDELFFNETADVIKESQIISFIR